MGILDLFKPRVKKENKEKTQAASNENGNYRVLIEMAEIISSGDKQVYADITILVQDYPAFYDKHRAWCEEILECAEEDDFHTIMLIIFSYWLTGYDTDYQYGSYIDWKEEPREILHSLTKALRNLKYPLCPEQLDFGDECDTLAVLKKIDVYFRDCGYILTGLDTDSDCYHLFIIKADNFSRLQKLSGVAGFKFISFE